jgi:hypothetical protein
MKNKINEIAQILSSETVFEIGLLTGIGGQILTCSELFLQEKISHHIIISSSHFSRFHFPDFWFTSIVFSERFTSKVKY